MAVPFWQVPAISTFSAGSGAAPAAASVRPVLGAPSAPASTGYPAGIAPITGLPPGLTGVGLAVPPTQATIATAGAARPAIVAPSQPIQPVAGPSSEIAQTAVTPLDQVVREPNFTVQLMHGSQVLPVAPPSETALLPASAPIVVTQTIRPGESKIISIAASQTPQTLADLKKSVPSQVKQTLPLGSKFLGAPNSICYSCTRPLDYNLFLAIKQAWKSGLTLLQAVQSLGLPTEPMPAWVQREIGWRAQETEFLPYDEPKPRVTGPDVERKLLSPIDECHYDQAYEAYAQPGKPEAKPLAIGKYMNRARLCCLTRIQNPPIGPVTRNHVAPVKGPLWGSPPAPTEERRESAALPGQVLPQSAAETPKAISGVGSPAVVPPGLAAAATS